MLNLKSGAVNSAIEEFGHFSTHFGGTKPSQERKQRYLLVCSISFGCFCFFIFGLVLSHWLGGRTCESKSLSVDSDSHLHLCRNVNTHTVVSGKAFVDTHVTRGNKTVKLSAHFLFMRNVHVLTDMTRPYGTLTIYGSKSNATFSHSRYLPFRFADGTQRDICVTESCIRTGESELKLIIQWN